jgi:hypothetical protein
MGCAFMDKIGAHFYISAVVNGLHGVMHRAPIADDNAFEAPLLFQDLVDQVLVLGTPLPAELIIGPHQRIHLANLHRGFKTGQVYLAQGTFAHFNADTVTLNLLVIGRIMLHTGRNALVLHTFDIANHHFRDQEGIFTQIFKITAVQWGADNINARAQYHVLSTIFSFAAQYAAESIALMRGSRWRLKYCLWAGKYPNLLHQELLSNRGHAQSAHRADHRTW